MKALKKETKKAPKKKKKKITLEGLKNEQFFFVEIIFFADTDLYRVSYWVKKQNKTPPSPTFSSKRARDNLRNIEFITIFKIFAFFSF